MKKTILTILFLFLSLPTFAGNLLQQEYETAKMFEMAQDPIFYNKTAKGLIEDDYLTYLNGGDSIYGLMKNQQKKLPKDSLDLKYINLMITKYDIIVKNLNPQLVKPNRIIVDDEDYKKLSDDVKKIMAGLNLILLR